MKSKKIGISKNCVLFVDFEELLHNSAVSDALNSDQFAQIIFQLFAALLDNFLFARVDISRTQRPCDCSAVGQSLWLEHHHQNAVELREIFELSVDRPALSQEVHMDHILDVIVSFAVLFDECLCNAG